MGQPLQLVLIGAPDDTKNLGVSALHHSMLSGLFRRLPDLHLTVFDNLLAPTTRSFEVDGRRHQLSTAGLRYSRRYHRRASLTNIRVSARLGGLGNPAAAALLAADAVLDISGGDSFSDIYGQQRFELIVQPKELTLARGRRLVLLPQTYGPFREAPNLERARAVVQHATLAMARDDRSYDALVQLSGAHLTAGARHRGVDVAFGLDVRDPADPRAEAYYRSLVSTASPRIGINVSGLTYNDEASSTRFGLLSPYRATITRLIERLLDETDATILLIPHVLAPRDNPESDPRAIEAVRASFPEAGDRLRIGPVLDDPSEVKWLIAQLDWFCGTRMHSTIAALSSGVPAAALAYSGKTLGVFESCDQGDSVADLRELSTEAAVDLVMRSWDSREAAGGRLSARLPDVHRAAADQMDLVVARCSGTDVAFPADRSNGRQDESRR